MADSSPERITPIQTIYIETGGSMSPIEPAISSESIPGIVGFSIRELVKLADASEDPNAMIYFQTKLPISDTGIYRFADDRVAIFSEERSVTVDDVEIDISPKTYNVLELLARRSGRITTHNHIREVNGWLDGDHNSNIVELYVGYSRRSLGEELGATEGGAIKTIPRHGYLAQKSVA